MKNRFADISNPLPRGLLFAAIVIMVLAVMMIYVFTTALMEQGKEISALEHRIQKHEEEGIQVLWHGSFGETHIWGITFPDGIKAGVVNRPGRVDVYTIEEEEERGGVRK